jgi:hypothetical protein
MQGQGENIRFIKCCEHMRLVSCIQIKLGLKRIISGESQLDVLFSPGP